MMPPRWARARSTARTSASRRSANAGFGTCLGGVKKSVRVYHKSAEENDGHFCSVTSQGCECYCHQIYRNMAQSPHFNIKHKDGRAVSKTTGAKFGRTQCVVPESGAGDKYNPFLSSQAFQYLGHKYNPVGPCQGTGCYVARSAAYSKSCDVRRNDGTPMAPALLTMCDNDGQPFTRQQCAGDTRASECLVNMIGNGGERASFMRVMNSVGAETSRDTSSEGLFFYDDKGVELLHIRPNGPEFQGHNDFNYFAAVPETAAFVFLKGGGSDTGEDYTGMAVSFFTCNDVVDSQAYVNECKDTPCHSENSYQCRDGDHDFTCMCKPGWEGKTCDTKTQKPE